MEKQEIRKRFLETFNVRDMKEINDYNVIMNNSKSIRNYKISKDRIYNWKKRGTKPLSIQVIQEAERRNYFRNYKIKELEWLSYLIGYNLGDGNISRALDKTWFYGVNTDLEKMIKHLVKFEVKPKIYTYKINNGKMVVSCRVFTRLFKCFGAIEGDKSTRNYNVPEWIYNGKRRSKIKKRFLQGMFDAELSNPKLMKKKRFSFQTMSFYMCKEINYIESGKNYLNQLKSLLYEFNITSTDVKKEREYIRKRDNTRHIQLYFIIHTNYINLSNFVKNIGFLYTSKRIINKKTTKEIHKLAELNKLKELKYKEAIELRKKGLSAYKIAKELNFSKDLIKSWIYKNRKPNHLSKKSNSS